MSKRMDDELLKDARAENKAQRSRFEVAPGATAYEQAAEKTAAAADAKAAADPAGQAGAFAAMPDPAESARDHFKEKFEEYFKGSAISGAVAVDMIDGLKSQLLWIYAQKVGVKDVPQDAFRMDAKSRDLAVFLTDYAIQNSLFDWLKKYPAVAASLILGISAGTSYLFIQSLKSSTDAAKKAQAENENLKKQLAEMQRRQTEARRENAEVVQDLNEQAQNDFDKLKAAVA